MPSLAELVGPEGRWSLALALLALVASVGLLGRLRIERRAAPPALIVGVLLSTLAGFAVIAWQVITEGPLVQIDTTLALWLQAHRSAALTGVLRAVTTLHNPQPVTALMVVAGLLLLARREQRWLLAFVLTAAGGTTLNVTLEPVRSRPVRRRPSAASRVLELQFSERPCRGGDAALRLRRDLSDVGAGGRCGAPLRDRPGDGDGAARRIQPPLPRRALSQ